MRISDWSSDVCSSDLIGPDRRMQPLRRQLIARRRASIQIQPQYLAQGRFRILRRIEFLPLAIGEEQIFPVRRKGDPPRIMAVALDIGAGPENHLHPVQLGRPVARLIETPGGQRHALAARTRLRKAEINRPILRKAEIGRAHVELQSLMRTSYAVFCLKKKKKKRLKK